MGRGSEEIERLDAGLAALAREEAALRLRIGQALEVLGRGGFHALGFSSLGAYVLERCDRSVRWAEAARCLARRVEGLPELRRAMAVGDVSWSMGELLARVAQPEDEARWVEDAKCRTVRQMRVLVADALAAERQVSGTARAPNAHGAVSAGASDETRGAAGRSKAGDAHEKERAGNAVSALDDDAVSAHDDDATCAHDDDATCVLTCTVAQEDAWLFEATRSLLGQMGVHGSSPQSEALLAEAHGTLLATLPKGALDTEEAIEQLVEASNAERHRWRAELARWRADAEVLCAPTLRDWIGPSGEQGHGERAAPGSRVAEGSVARLAAEGMVSLERANSEALDAHVRSLAAGLARHELTLSEQVLRFHRAKGWQRLGYATETQYARERLGLSPSSMLARRSLARRLEKLPSVAKALGAGHIGIEAALQVVRVATPRTQAAWVQRARHRTLKHLREEVGAALVAVRFSKERHCLPPTDGDLAAFQELERAVVSGYACQAVPAPAARAGTPLAEERIERDQAEREKSSTAEPASQPRRAWHVMLGSLAAWLASGFQTSAGPRVMSGPAMSGPAMSGSPVGGPQVGASAGRVTLRLRVSRATYGWWRALEALARLWLPQGMSWLRFLCLSMWQAWRHLLGADVAYGRIYIRDRYRCSSPVCSRRDVTPHHLRFRSSGGGDEDENLTSICTWCHLCGVHGGRIRAVGPAQHIRWEIGAPSSPCLVVDGRERWAA